MRYKPFQVSIGSEKDKFLEASLRTYRRGKDLQQLPPPLQLLIIPCHAQCNQWPAPATQIQFVISLWLFHKVLYWIPYKFAYLSRWSSLACLDKLHLCIRDVLKIMSLTDCKTLFFNKSIYEKALKKTPSLISHDIFLQIYSCE